MGQKVKDGCVNKKIENELLKGGLRMSREREKEPGSKTVPQERV